MRKRLSFAMSFATVCLVTSSMLAEVMLQWFETEWDEMYRRLPEVSEIGYDYMWIPPPTKAPTGLGTKWGNVGYSLCDRFDIGDIPQRGSLATRYGTRGSLRNMVDKSHQCDVKIMPDIIMNHNGNGPDFREYPGMVPEDFHVQWEEGHCNTLNYKRAPRMDQWSHGNGYGGTMWQDLCSLIDIRTEPDDRFTGGNNTPGWNFVDGTSYLRHVGQYDKYPYYPVGYTNENASEMLHRWIAWLGDAMDYDGLRLDAGKHTPHEFFGTEASGFLHEAEYNFDLRRNNNDSNDADELFSNYLRRDDGLVFAEILSYWSDLEYWHNNGNPMRFIDYPLKQKLYDAFSNGNMASLTGGGGGIDPIKGIMYAWGHDEAGPSKINLAYAYILTHVGFPMVYFTGNNITWDDHNNKTWMRPGYDSQALADEYNDISNLVWIHQQFARGSEYDRWNENDFFAYERYEDDGDDTPEEGEGLLLVALNDSGSDQTRYNVTCSFPIGTVLHDYTGHNASDETVYDGGGGVPQVNITVPGNSGQGWVCYAPKIADGIGDNTVTVKDNGSTAANMTWVVPGGIHGSDKTRYIPRVTSSNMTLDVFFAPAAGTTVNSVMMKWGQGETSLTTNYFDTGNSIVSGGYQSCEKRNSTNWYVDISITETNIPEGLNVVKFRAFNDRNPAYPALFNTFTKLIYVDRRGPEIDVTYPANAQAIQGEAVAIIENADYTAYGMTVALDGGSSESAHEIMKGLWKHNLTGLSSGNHTMVVTTTEADWAATRQTINTSTYTRVFSVVPNANAIALNHSEGVTKETTFFDTVVTASGSPDTVRLYWDGYQLPFNGGSYTNTFNGEVIHSDNIGNIETGRLWGAFCNGQHFFEAERIDSGVTSRTSRRVTFDLYGINAIDSDGDSIPDNVEMPFIDSDGAPGPDSPWPGDSNKDFVPNYGENWTRLNPYNHSTFYSGQWDDQNDFDGDGFSNGAEVLAGYGEGNIYKYSIYDSGSYPTGSSTVASSAIWTPTYAVRTQNLVITYSPNEGPLENESPVRIHIGHSLKTQGAWQEVTNYLMSAIDADWVYDYMVPSNASSVDFVFRNSAGDIWDNNNGSDWQANVAGSTATYFNINGVLDSADYIIHETNMYIWAAVKGDNLYIATWGVSESGGGSDHFIYVTDELGDASDPAPGWNKDGQIFVDTSTKPYLTAEGENDWEAWNNISGDAQSTNSGVLEGEINLTDAFGTVPDAIYVASIAYETGEGGGIASQGPSAWSDDDNVDVTELLRVPVASIRDEDLDGYHDAGSPNMWTVVNGHTNDANYGLRRIFVNELAGDITEITVIIEPNADGTNQVTDVELFSNINRRDFAVMEEDPSDVTTSSSTNYYRAYSMADIGDGKYSYTITARKCGVYRINARYKVNGGNYVYYTDYGLRRDCAVVVSPTKALEILMYELNPLFAEATADDFYGRSTFRDMYLANTNKPDYINTNHFGALGLNMIWLQPIHPIGSDGRQNDPATGLPYDPGSPYAVRNYWKVNSILGDPSSETNAVVEFSSFVQAMDQVGVGVMLDGTFNHSAWDCEIGQMGVDMGITTNASDFIRDVRPQWYSQEDNYGEHATYYESGATHDVATAPDRIDFGKWSDAADFYFGTYAALVQEAPFDTNNAWSSSWYKRYLREDDFFEGHDQYTREIWEYFAAYPLYWLEQTGHPEGTPKSQSYKGIDGLRCDFAQGLPNRFWEYTINKTRSTKWDFLFMAESLDGYSEVDGSKRHGVGYRSSRQFDILNENMVFYWRNNFFDYPDRNNPQSYTDPTRQALDDRRNAFDASPILLNLTSHDEIYPSHDPYRVLYAHAACAVVDGVPMLFYGQEAGAQNDYDTYANGGEITSDDHNFERYELNFGKSIPNFKRYNHMTNIWHHRDWELQNAYARINNARLSSPALVSQNLYFLKTNSVAYDPNIFAVAKYEEPGVSASTQDVVLAFVNNNHWDSENRWGTFLLNDDYNGKNRFGIETAKSYNIVDLISTNPTTPIWGSPVSGTDLINNGITVGLTGAALEGKQAQYLKLYDTSVGVNYPDAEGDGTPDYADWDDDNDGLPDWWELMYALSPTNATGIDGASGDKDGDGASNEDELAAGTNPDDATDKLVVRLRDSSGNMLAEWGAKVDKDYQLEYTDDLMPPVWSVAGARKTALSTNQTEIDYSSSSETSRFYRVTVQP